MPDYYPAATTETKAADFGLVGNIVIALDYGLPDADMVGKRRAYFRSKLPPVPDRSPSQHDGQPFGQPDALARGFSDGNIRTAACLPDALGTPTLCHRTPAHGAYTCNLPASSCGPVLDHFLLCVRAGDQGSTAGS